MRLRIAVDTIADCILVVIDSGIIRAHGIAQVAGAMMRNRILEKIVARKPEQAGSAGSLRWSRARPPRLWARSASPLRSRALTQCQLYRDGNGTPVSAPSIRA